MVKQIVVIGPSMHVESYLASTFVPNRILAIFFVETHGRSCQLSVKCPVLDDTTQSDFP